LTIEGQKNVKLNKNKSYCQSERPQLSQSESNWSYRGRCDRQ